MHLLSSLGSVWAYGADENSSVEAVPDRQQILPLSCLCCQSTGPYVFFNKFWHELAHSFSHDLQNLALLTITLQKPGDDDPSRTQQFHVKHRETHAVTQGEHVNPSCSKRAGCDHADAMAGEKKERAHMGGGASQKRNCTETATGGRKAASGQRPAARRPRAVEWPFRWVQCLWRRRRMLGRS